MPAKAGRVRMIAKNRIHSNVVVQSHSTWQNAICHDPHAPKYDDYTYSSEHKSSSAETVVENPYASFWGVRALARIASCSSDEVRGTCMKCGRVGHRNLLIVKDNNKEKDPEAVQAALLSVLKQIKGNEKDAIPSKESVEEEDDCNTSDSEVDLEIERIIAETYGMKNSRKWRSSEKHEDFDDRLDSELGERKKRGRSKQRRSKKRETSDFEGECERYYKKNSRKGRSSMKHNDSDDGLDYALGERKKRGRSKKRSTKGEISDFEGAGESKKREKRRKNDKSSEEEAEGQRYRHKRKSRKEKRCSDDSDSEAFHEFGQRHMQKNWKPISSSDFEVSGSDVLWVWRSISRTEKRSHF